MSREAVTYNSFYKGISPSDKLGGEGYFNFAWNLDIYSEPTALTLNPATVKDSGTTVTSQILWIVPGTPYDTNTYFYDHGGKIYKRTSGGTWSVLQTTANSVGQGMELSNDYVYYTQNTQIGRYGPLSGAASFTDNWQTGLNDTSTTGFAPIKAFRAGFAVGNGNQLSWWDGSVWTLAKLTFPAGFNVRSIEIVDEFLAVACWRGTSITASEESYIFFWDGDSTTFNFFIKVEEGAVNGMVTNQNRLFGVVGSSGAIAFLYPNFQIVHRIPKLEFSKYIEVYPGAFTNWKNIIHFGAGSNGNSANVFNGVYQWGTKSNIYPEALNFGYTISTGSQQSTQVQVTAVKGIGNQMFIAWKDGANYGVDLVSQTGSPFASGTLQFLNYEGGTIQQIGDVTREDLALNLKAYYKALASGESIQLGYSTNRSGSFTTGIADSTVGDTHQRLPVDSDKARFYEFQAEAILAASGTTSPTLYGVSIKADDLRSEELSP